MKNQKSTKITRIIAIYDKIDNNERLTGTLQVKKERVK